MLSYLLARRLARDGRWEAACPYYPRDLQSAAISLMDLQNKAMAEGQAADKGLDIQSRPQWPPTQGTPRRVDAARATFLFTAAVMTRNRGMELLGTEVEPDWRMFEGTLQMRGASTVRGRTLPQGQIDPFPCSPVEGGTPSKFGVEAYLSVAPTVRPLLAASDDEKQRVARNALACETRYHYRHTASNLMWRAAQYLPDNDVLTAQALYMGGAYIKSNDPQTADAFYKAMVWRNFKLPYTRVALKEKWFPEVAPMDYRAPTRPAAPKDHTNENFTR
jgi:hypothetical protein